MMKSLLTALFLFCASTIYSIEECSTSYPCDFIRGDVDCDGDVDGDDLNDLYFYTYSNADAADCNDDGSVDSTDITSLANWLVYGYPALPEPFGLYGTSSGLDCTADSLENCCSPVSSGSTSAASETIDRDYYTFDYASTGTPLTVQTSDCASDSNQTADYDLKWALTDTRSISLLRMYEEFVDINATVTINVAFDHGYACSPCTQKSNTLKVDFSSAFAYVYYRRDGGSLVGVYLAPADITFGGDASGEVLTYTYSRATSCQITSSDSSPQYTSVDINNIQSLVADNETGIDCDDIELTNILISNVTFSYLPSGESIANSDEIQVTSTSVSFSIDECTDD